MTGYFAAYFSESRRAELLGFLLNGVSGPGQRHRAIYLIAMDSIANGHSVEKAINRVVEWARNGGLDKSRAVLHHGLESEVEVLPMLVRRVYKRRSHIGSAQTVTA